MNFLRNLAGRALGAADVVRPRLAIAFEPTRDPAGVSLDPLYAEAPAPPAGPAPRRSQKSVPAPARGGPIREREGSASSGDPIGRPPAPPAASPARRELAARPAQETAVDRDVPSALGQGRRQVRPAAAQATEGLQVRANARRAHPGAEPGLAKGVDHAPPKSPVPKPESPVGDQPPVEESLAAETSSAGSADRSPQPFDAAGGNARSGQQARHSVPADNWSRRGPERKPAQEPAPFRPRPADKDEEAAEEPSIHVHIDRIEVRSPVSPAPAKSPAPRQPSLSLDEYLERSGEERR